MTDPERVLKVTVTESDFERLRQAPVLKDSSPEAPRRSRFQRIYFDTDDWDLRRASLELSVKSQSNSTVQAAVSHPRHGAARDPVANIAKLDDKTPKLRAISDPKLRRRFARAIGKRTLQPRVKITGWRTSQDLELKRSQQVRLIMDSGTLEFDGRSTPQHDVTLVAPSGRPATLLRAAETLLGDQTFAPAHDSLPAIAEEIETEGSRSEKILRFPVPSLKPSMSVTEGLCLIAGTAAAQALYNWERTCATTDPSGPHQLRVGLRRFRTALRVFKGVLPDKKQTRLRRDAQALASTVGLLRDADVLIADVVVPVLEAQPELVGGEALERLLRTHIEHQRAIVRDSLQSAKWSRLKVNLMLFDCVVDGAPDNGTDPLETQLEPLARTSLRKSWRQVRRWGKRMDELSIPERHEMRKALKTLRYACEFFASLFPGSAPIDFVRQLKKLQDTFGYLNDVALADQLPGILKTVGPGNTDTPSLIGAVQKFHKRRASHAWRRARERWRALAAEERFWSK